MHDDAHVLPHAPGRLIDTRLRLVGSKLDEAARLVRRRRAAGAGAVTAFARSRSTRTDAAGERFRSFTGPRAVAARWYVNWRRLTVIPRMNQRPRRSNAFYVLFLRRISGINDARLDLRRCDGLGVNDGTGGGRRTRRWSRFGFRSMLDAGYLCDGERRNRCLGQRLRVPRHDAGRDLVQCNRNRKAKDQPAPRSLCRARRRITEKP